jgi:transcriptional regulator with XRE-family HTH domain
MAKTFGELIRAARQGKGWMIKDLIERVKTDKISLTPSFMTRVEQYDEVPGPDLILRMAEVLGLNPEELLKVATTNRVNRIKQNIEEVYQEKLTLYRKQKERGK